MCSIEVSGHFLGKRLRRIITTVLWVRCSALSPQWMGTAFSSKTVRHHLVNGKLGYWISIYLPWHFIFHLEFMLLGFARRFPKESTGRVLETSQLAVSSDWNFIILKCCIVEDVVIVFMLICAVVSRLMSQPFWNTNGCRVIPQFWAKAKTSAWDESRDDNWAIVVAIPSAKDGCEIVKQ